MGSKERKTAAAARILRSRAPGSPGRALVVGCGSGEEAIVLSRELGTEAVGIDVDTSSFGTELPKGVELREGNAAALEFEDRSFGLVYSYHALEHFADPRAALGEMKRVLADGGVFFVGAPNRSRLLGYIGSDEGWRLKVLWNAADMKARLTGKFRNEEGAHAGFTSRELAALLGEVFPRPIEVTDLYYREVYSRHRGLIDLMVRTGFGRVLFPSVYFCGTKGPPVP